MTASFKKIKSDKDISEKEGFGTFLIAAIFAVGLAILLVRMFSVNPFLSGLILIAFAWLGRPLLRRYYGDYAKPGDIEGDLTFSTSSIAQTQNGEKQILNISDVHSLDLKYNYIQGQQFAYKDIIHNGLALLKISTKSNSLIEVKFLIETEEQLNGLKPIWAEYHNRNIKIKESMGKYDIKTFIFEKK